MMRSLAFWKKTLYLLLFSLSCLGIQDFCHKKTQGFSLGKARSAYAPTSKKNLSFQETSFLYPLLEQPFYFQKKGCSAMSLYPTIKNMS